LYSTTNFAHREDKEQRFGTAAALRKRRSQYQKPSFPKKTYLFTFDLSAEGATEFPAWGNAPGILPKKIKSAEGASSSL